MAYLETSLMKYMIFFRFLKLINNLLNNASMVMIMDGLSIKNLHISKRSTLSEAPVDQNL